MTSQQRDELAKMAGGKIQLTAEIGGRCYHWPDGTFLVGSNWLPESSRDDCRPLFAEIERRGLWGEFDKNLDEIRNFECRVPSVRYYLGLTRPADIVAAFRKTIEEADGKEGE